MTIPWTEVANSDGSLDLGVTSWTPVTQEQVDFFARATGDSQFIHVDPARAAQDGPFGGTIAHGYLLMSMMPVLLSQRIAFPRDAVVLNYGLGKLRFVNPVRVGERIRGRFVLTSRNRIELTKIILKVRALIEVENAQRPAVEADPLIALVHLRAESGAAASTEPAEGLL